MNNLNFLENLIIKQTCRFYAYKFEMCSNQSTTEDPTNIYSLKFLKTLYDHPKDNIKKVTKAAITAQNNDKVNIIIDDEKCDFIEKRVLLEYFKKLVDMKSQPAKQWTDLQHYLCFVYRYCMTRDPDTEQEVLSQHFIDDMRNIVCSLLEEDEIQLCLRLFCVVREYTVFAHKLHKKITNVESSIESLFYYYEAFLSASKNISRIFPELENILINTYKLGWLDINTSIFMYYFYETPNVQDVIQKFGEIKDSVSIKTAGIYTVLTELHKLWRSQILGINGVIAKKLGAKFKGLDNNMMSAHKKILSKNFWIDRTIEEKSLQDIHLFDCQLFTLVGNKSIGQPDPTLDDSGQCICEDCLLIKYKYLLENTQNKTLSKSIKVSCRFCKEHVNLDHFQQHINECTFSELGESKCKKFSHIISDNINIVKLEMSANAKQKSLNGENKFITKLSSLNTNCGIPKTPNSENAENSPSKKNFTSNGDNVHIAKLALSELKPTEVNQEFLHQNLLQYSNSISQGNLDKENKCQLTNKVSKIVSSIAENTSKLTLNKNDNSKDKGSDATTKPSRSTHSSNKVNGVNFPCGHSCRLEEELKTEFKKAYEDTCDHYKESKKCDCTFCEVFGTTSSLVHKENETRNRLRIRLNQRNDKCSNKINTKSHPKLNSQQQLIKTNVAKVDSTVSKEPIQSVQEKTKIPTTISSDKKEIKTELIKDDIHGLLSYINGNTNIDKLAIAEKKAAKKARQRRKKEEERLKLEEIERKRLEEEKQKNEERLRNEGLARLMSEKAAKNLNKENKKKKQTNKNCEFKTELMEETIPAMVTIKRVVENDNSLPTVTITLKGSTPDQDKLLYTLVNGHNGTDGQINDDKKTKKKKQQNQQKPVTKTAKLEVNSSNNNKKTKTKSDESNSQQQQQQQQQNKSLITKELKVILAVNPVIVSTNKKSKQNKQICKNANSKQSKDEPQKEDHNNKNKENDINIPMLKLPPGITITKVERPMPNYNRNYKLSSIETSPYDAIPVTKSGVIVVDTERLIKQSSSNVTTNDTLSTITSKKSKKKRNKKQQQSSETTTNTTPTPVNKQQSSMVTLKNPVFRNMPCFQPQENEISNLNNLNSGQYQQAAIFKNENGMVTIRSSRLHQSLSSGSQTSNLLSDLKPVLGPEVSTTCMSTCNLSESSQISPFNAQQILSGLPGIEITKVDKNATDKHKSSQTAEVSIIPTFNGDFDKDDLHYDNVFTPRDLEEDMDADERELEAFKRFCQQSVPPKRKEKVTHLNVKDIVLKKKNDKIST